MFRGIRVTFCERVCMCVCVCVCDERREGFLKGIVFADGLPVEKMSIKLDSFTVSCKNDTLDYLSPSKG